VVIRNTTGLAEIEKRALAMSAIWGNSENISSPGGLDAARAKRPGPLLADFR
jgi:hypothetical protein